MDYLRFIYQTFCCGSIDQAGDAQRTRFPSSSIKINKAKYKTLRLLGEGGFSYVYLCSDQNDKLYALKKIRCAFGEESYQLAMREVHAYNMFDHKGIIKCLDFTTLAERNSKVVYILFPYYKRGNLQDLINSNTIDNIKITEADALSIVHGVCESLVHLHEHKSPEMFGKERSVDEASVPFLQADANTTTDDESQHICPYGHFDLKPGNIMFTDDGSPILMDFGSCKIARREIRTRSDALKVQDEAAEHSTMPYRAPELFDTQTNSDITEAVDIWSLGCTIFAMLYGHSPFETVQTEQGSIAMAVLNCRYEIPAGNHFSENLNAMIIQCLSLEPANRPTARELIDKIQKITQH